ncbi:MAG TPA: 50S ribosomal protein L25 [Patescibacteria group bacterium]|nr:50S ribosomal protein L25 [Patescibacteria group bacterium]
MTATKYLLNAKKRTVIGKKVKLLRAARLLPAHIYGNTEPINIQLDEKAFLTMFEKAGETSVLYVQVEGEKDSRPVLVADYSVDPVKGTIIHIDLRQVNLNIAVKANVPIELIGESEAVKAGGVLIQVQNEIEVEALPTDLPEKFELDISALKLIGGELKVSDLKFDASKVTLSLAPEEILVIISEPKVEVEPVVAEPTEVETTVQGAKKEGEEAEGSAGAPQGAASAKKEEKPKKEEK